MEDEIVFRDTQDLAFIQNRVQTAYTTYKDLLSPTTSWESSKSKDSTISPSYISRNSIFLKDPSSQKQFREEVLEKMQEVPSSDPFYLLSDILLSEFLEVKLHPSPFLVCSSLSAFFYSRVHFLQDFKYKFLLNWASISLHTSINQSSIREKIRCLDSEILTCIESYEKLRLAEDIPLVPGKEGVERNPEVQGKDIEYYIDCRSRSLSLSRSIQTLIHRVKWAWVGSRTEIWKRSMSLLAELKKQSVERMKLLTGLDDIGEQKVIVSLVTNVNLKNLKKQQEIQRRAKAEHSTFAEEHKNLNEQLLRSSNDNIDAPPQILTELSQMNGLLDCICKEFKLVGDVGSDDGHALSYQITHLLPDLFEVQRKRQEWKAYEAPEKDLTAIRMASVQSLKRASTVRRLGTDIMTHQISGYKVLKVLSLKDVDWNSQIIKPFVQTWQKRQKNRLFKFNKNDSLLKASFELLDVQDISTINRVIEEFSMNYCERASKRGVLKTDLGLSDEDIKKRYFSSLLSDNQVLTNQSSEDLIDLPLSTIKGLYTLKYLKSRGLKLKLFELFNYFTSCERRLSLDLHYSETISKTLFHPSASSKHPLLESLDGEITQYLPDKFPELYGRQDTIETIEGNLYIVDETGEYIIYKPVEHQVKLIFEELLLLGSFFIDKYEVWSEDQGENFPVIDRDFLTNELLEEEVKFQEVKARLVSDYMEIYKHAVEETWQRKIAQRVVDLIALRPRLYLRGSYFTQSYWAHRQALEKHSELLKVLIGHFNLVDSNDLVPEYSALASLWDLVDTAVEEISTIHETETPVAISTLERSVWESAYELWRTAGSYKSPFSEQIILDNPSSALHLIRSIHEELRDKHLLPKFYPAMFETKGKPQILSDKPDEISLLCGLFEAHNLRCILEKHFEETQVLEGIHRRMSLSIKRESVEVEFINFFGNHPHISNLRDWPGTRPYFKLPCFEASPVLTENLDLKSPTGFRMMILPLGLEEMKAVTEYQVMHKHLLIVACLINQAAVDKWERQIAEIEIARTMNYIPKKTKVHWPSVLGRKGEGLIEEKAENEVKSIKARIFSQVSETCMDIRKLKLAHRENMKENFLRILKKYTLVIGEKSEYYENICRYLLAQVINGYCREILRDAYTHSIKLHILKISSEVKKILSVLPPNLKENLSDSLILDKDLKISNLLSIPSVEQVLSLPGIQSEDSWKHWDPYFFAETPDIIQKKIKNIAFRPRITENEVTCIRYLHEWSFSSKALSQLEASRAASQVLHLLLFEDVLCMKSLDLMDLQETVMEGKNYWEKKEIEESDQMHLRAVDGLLAQASPVDSFYRILQGFVKKVEKITNEIQKVPENSVVLLEQRARIGYLKFATVLFECYEFVMSSSDRFEISEGMEIASLITNCFRYNRRSINIPDRSLETDCSLINLALQKLFIDNTPGQVMSGTGLKPLSSVLICSSELIRSFSVEKFNLLEQKLTRHIQSKPQTELFEQQNHSINYLSTVLSAFRLRSCYKLVTRNNDLSCSFEKYRQVKQFYENTVGLKTASGARRIREDEYLSAFLSEGKTLKELLNMMICRFSINFIHEECEIMFDPSKLAISVAVGNEFSCNADRSYDDITKRIGCLHHYLNHLRNRCTLVEAPTCGKAHVFLVRDMTKLTKRFADHIVKFMETEFRVREESFLVQLEQLLKVRNQKDEEISELGKSLKALQGNLDNLVNAQLSQKGNSLIYELDRSHRKLSEIKANMKLMPKQIREIVYLDYKEEIEKNRRKILDMRQNFFNFKSELTQELKADISFHKTNAFSEIKNKTSKSKAKEINVLITEDLSFTKKKQKIDLSFLSSQITKIRILKIWAKTFKKNKFQNNIKSLQEQLTSNQFLWEQLNESQRREALLKQELSYTQQSLAAAEKLADKLQTSIEDMNNQRLRLQQYKSNKGKRLNELEQRVKQQEKIEHKDNSLLLNQFYLQNEKVQSLQINEEKAGQDYIPVHIKCSREITNLKKTLKREQNMKLNAFDELNRFRNEVKNINKEPESRVKEMRAEYQKLTGELKLIRDQNALFKKRIIDMGDHEFLSAYQGRPDPRELLKSVSSRGTSNKSFDLNN
jgi:hypothetical protein